MNKQDLLDLRDCLEKFAAKSPFREPWPIDHDLAIYFEIVQLLDELNVVLSYDDDRKEIKA